MTAKDAQMNRVLFLVTAALVVLCAGCDRPAIDRPLPHAADTSANAQPSYRDAVDIAGIALGTKIQVPECKKERRQGMILYATENQAYPCFEDVRGARGTMKSQAGLPDGPDYDGVTSIELGSAAVPAGVSPKANILMLSGVPEEVSLSTDGVESQDRLYALLVEKYGPPSETKEVQLQNTFGARYRSIEASWVLRRINVHFFGVLGSPSEGSIIARTDKAREFFLTRRNEAASSF
ncbi:TPA: hypothetical protein ACXM52_000312 [Stenotrophomonas maltophilia]